MIAAGIQNAAPTYFDAREGFQPKIYNALLAAEGIPFQEISPARLEAPDH